MGVDTHRRVISYDAAVRAAIGLFIRTATVDMDALAQRLCVSRATLYRVVAGRDRLLGDVLWRQAEYLFVQASLVHHASDGEGADRILAVLRRFGVSILGAEPFRTFMAAEPETAIRVLFTPAGGVHERFVCLNRGLIEQAIAAGSYAPPFDLDDLAYVFVRIFESIWYAELLAGLEPDLDVADRVARAVLLAG